MYNCELCYEQEVNDMMGHYGVGPDIGSSWLVIDLPASSLVPPFPAAPRTQVLLSISSALVPPPITRALLGARGTKAVETWRSMACEWRLVMKRRSLSFQREKPGP